MKRLALVAAVIVLAACSKENAATTDTTSPTMAPAPAAAPMDTGMAHMDSMRMDSTKADTTKKP